MFFCFARKIKACLLARNVRIHESKNLRIKESKCMESKKLKSFQYSCVNKRHNKRRRNWNNFLYLSH